MTRYIALLRGVNVGGNNKISMPELRAAFERYGFDSVSSYINSGNIIFSSDLDAQTARSAVESIIESNFGLSIPVCVISAADLIEAVEHAPDWWNSDKESKHNAAFVIPPVTVEDVMAFIGETKPEYESAACHGCVVFWSAPIQTFSRTRLTKIVESKVFYNQITIRNANTTLKLSALVKDMDQGGGENL